MRGAAWLVIAAALLAACGGAPRTEDSPHDTAPTAAPPAAEIVRTCETSGRGGVSADSQAGALVFGPLALGSLRALPEGILPAPRTGQRRFPALESIAVVRAATTVVLAVSRADARVAALVYDERKFRDDGMYRISELDRVVRFEACRDRRFNQGRSQFDGGIVVAGPRCVTLDVHVVSPQPASYRRRVAVGAQC